MAQLVVSPRSSGSGHEHYACTAILRAFVVNCDLQIIMFVQRRRPRNGRALARHQGRMQCRPLADDPAAIARCQPAIALSEHRRQNPGPRRGEPQPHLPEHLSSPPPEAERLKLRAARIRRWCGHDRGRRPLSGCPGHLHQGLRGRPPRPGVETEIPVAEFYEGTDLAGDVSGEA